MSFESKSCGPVVEPEPPNCVRNCVRAPNVLRSFTGISGPRWTRTQVLGRAAAHLGTTTSFLRRRPRDSSLSRPRYPYRDMRADGHSSENVWGTLPSSAAEDLDRTGFAVIPGPFPAERCGAIADAYDAAVDSAVDADVRVGATSTRVTDFVNRGPVWDPVYVYPPLLDAAARVVGRAFTLSSFHARTLHAGADVLDIHVDVERDSSDWPLLGFILMIDEFSARNGATRFLPGSHRWPRSPRGARLQDHGPELVSACGPAGSLLVFNGSTWHGQGINVSGKPRRSLQGAFIPRDGRVGTDFDRRMSPSTRGRRNAGARHVLAVPDGDDPAAAENVDSVPSPSR